MTDALKPCMWCDQPSTRLCDAPIGFGAEGAIRDKNGNVTGLLAGLDNGFWTCDAPMCDSHAKQVGFISGEIPDSIDYCAFHASRDDCDMSKLIIFPNESDRIRREIHANIRRERIKNERV